MAALPGLTSTSLTKEWTKALVSVSSLVLRNSLIADVHRRAAGDDAAGATHPWPGSSPAPTCASGVPVRGCARTADGRRGWGLNGSRPLLTHKPHRTHTRCQLLLTPVLARYSGCHGVTCLLHVNRCVVRSCSATCVVVLRLCQ